MRENREERETQNLLRKSGNRAVSLNADLDKITGLPESAFKITSSWKLRFKPYFLVPYED